MMLTKRQAKAAAETQDPRGSTSEEGWVHEMGTEQGNFTEKGIGNMIWT